MLFQITATFPFMPWAPQRGVQIPSGYDFFSTTRTHSNCIGMLTVGKQDVDSVETGAADSLIRARQGQPKARSARCARDGEIAALCFPNPFFLL